MIWRHLAISFGLSVAYFKDLLIFFLKDIAEYYSCNYKNINVNNSIMVFYN